MAVELSPQLLDPSDCEIKNSYDAVCFQLVLTVEALMQIRPNATFTYGDLITFYMLQHGGTASLLTKTINGLLGYQYWEDNVRVAPLKKLLRGRLLAGKTNDALMVQIMLGDTNHAEKVGVDNELYQCMAASTDEDFFHEDAVSLRLRPGESITMEYERRLTTPLGRAAITGHSNGDRGFTKSYIDAIALTSQNTGVSRKILVVSTSKPHRVEQVRII